MEIPWEILWKSFNNILWTTDDSAIGRINICGDPDSAIGRKKPQKKSLGATVLDKIMWCMHSISSVKSDFLGSTTTKCENMLYGAEPRFKV